MKKRWISIGGNGYESINNYRVERMKNNPTVTTAQLDVRSSQLNRVVCDLTKILQNMPEDMFAEYGSALVSLGEQINNYAGEIAIAHDERLGA